MKNAERYFETRSSNIEICWNYGTSYVEGRKVAIVLNRDKTKRLLTKYIKQEF